MFLEGCEGTLKEITIMFLKIVENTVNLKKNTILAYYSVLTVLYLHSSIVNKQTRT